MKSKSFAIRQHGLNGLMAITHDVPALESEQVLVKMTAMALNYRDLEILMGNFSVPFDLPLIPLSDGTGEVVAVGEKVSRVKIGDRVIFSFWEQWIDGAFDPLEAGRPLGGPIDGLLREFAVSAEDRLVVIPDVISDVDAATLACAGTTAWHSLIAAGNLQPGETVLIQGTGGVSLFAMQLSILAGAQVIITSSSDAKLERAKALGATATVNYRRTPEWSAEIMKLTAGKGVDHITEVGGPGSFSQSLKAIRSGGQINMIGYLGGTSGLCDPLDIFRRQVTVRGIPVGSRAMLQSLVNALATSGIRPVIDQTFDWTEASAAFKHMHAGNHFGKIVLTTEP